MRHILIKHELPRTIIAQFFLSRLQNICISNFKYFFLGNFSSLCLEWPPQELKSPLRDEKSSWLDQKERLTQIFLMPLASWKLFPHNQGRNSSSPWWTPQGKVIFLCQKKIFFFFWAANLKFLSVVFKWNFFDLNSKWQRQVDSTIRTNFGFWSNFLLKTGKGGKYSESLVFHFLCAK